jgi:hypothetical protein
MESYPKMQNQTVFAYEEVLKRWALPGKVLPSYRLLYSELCGALVLEHMITEHNQHRVYFTSVFFACALLI